MESNKNGPFSHHSPGERMQPLALVGPLMQNAASMHHVDELFLWLANAMVQQWSIPLVQFYVTQTYSTEPAQTEVRAAASFDPSLLQNKYLNIEVIIAIERNLQSRQDFIALPIENIFPPKQAYFFAQYNLHHWVGYFLRRNELLAFMRDQPTEGKIATPLHLMVSIFTQQFPSQQFLRAVSFLLGQGLRIAEGRGFFTPITPMATPLTASPAAPPINPYSPPEKKLSRTDHFAVSYPPSERTSPRSDHFTVPYSPPERTSPRSDHFAEASTSPRLPSQADHFTLDALVPALTGSIEEIQASNPFGSAQIIADKNSRRVYAVIDGKKNIAEITREVNMSKQETINALRYLLQQGRIQLHKPGGETIDSAAFFPPLS